MNCPTKCTCATMQHSNGNMGSKSIQLKWHQDTKNTLHFRAPNGKKRRNQMDTKLKKSAKYDSFVHQRDSQRQLIILHYRSADVPVCLSSLAQIVKKIKMLQNYSSL